MAAVIALFVLAILSVIILTGVYVFRNYVFFGGSVDDFEAISRLLPEHGFHPNDPDAPDIARAPFSGRTPGDLPIKIAFSPGDSENRSTWDVSVFGVEPVGSLGSPGLIGGNPRIGLRTSKEHRAPLRDILNSTQLYVFAEDSLRITYRGRGSYVRFELSASAISSWLLDSQVQGLCWLADEMVRVGILQRR